jgi:predicted flap endonuclease-1-like 5' DNA nuclease
VLIALLVSEMPSMRIFLAKSPYIQTYSFKPGDKINIQVKFETSNFPDRYRLQIIDHKHNSRLNRYGGSIPDIPEINVSNWPIPLNIREEHLGIWFVKLDDISNRLVEDSTILGIMKQIFFVEKELEIVKPVKIEMEVVEEEEIPIIFESVSDEVISAQGVIESSTDQSIIPIEGEDLSTVYYPVTDIRGIGKTYAERLRNVQIDSVSDFWYFPDRISLAEIMRVSDTRLEKMLEDAEIILSEEADRKVSIELVQEVEVVPNDLKSVKGLNVQTIKKLEALGVKNKSDLLNFEDISVLRTNIQTSSEKFRSILASVGKIIEPDDVRKPVPVEIPNQPVMLIKGIGKVAERKLNSVSIITVQDFFESDFEVVKKVVTIKQYEKWMINTSILLEKPVKIKPQEKRQETATNELLLLPGIGPKTLEKLNTLNINTKENLIEFEDQEKLRKILRMSDARFNTFIKSIKTTK